jgi:methionyl-tRNA synthetase
MEVYALHEAVAAAYQIVDAANEYIAETAPWTLAKDAVNADRLTGVLFDVVEAIRVAAVLLTPVMPASCAEILRRVGERTSASDLRLDRDARWRTDGERNIIKGNALWPRSEERAKEAITVEEKPSSGSVPVPAQQPQPASSPVPASAIPAPAAAAAVSPPSAVSAGVDGRIAIDDFMRVELRVAKVLEAEAVPKSKKLIKLKVDVGTEQRTVVAGIAEAYQPEQLVGRTIVIVANLKPAKLMGIESNGMVLAASPEGGLPSLVAVDPALPPGSRVR